MSSQENEPLQEVVNESSVKEAEDDPLKLEEEDLNQQNEQNQEYGSEEDNSDQNDEENTIEELKRALEYAKEQSQANLAQAELAQADLDTALRAKAEMDNLLKRKEREFEKELKYALGKFVNELLPIIDSLELGISASEEAESIDNLKEGMHLTLQMFKAAIEKFGVKTLNPEGEKFNTEQHEAVSTQDIEGLESGSVVAVMQKGYELNGRLVRPAMVVVAK